LTDFLENVDVIGKRQEIKYNRKRAILQ